MEWNHLIPVSLVVAAFAIKLWSRKALLAGDVDRAGFLLVGSAVAGVAIMYSLVALTMMALSGHPITRPDAFEMVTESAIVVWYASAFVARAPLRRQWWMIHGESAAKTLEDTSDLRNRSS